MAGLCGTLPSFQMLFVDDAYKGPKFAKAVAEVLPLLEFKIVKLSELVDKFVVLPKRWIAERTIGWLNSLSPQL